MSEQDDQSGASRKHLVHIIRLILLGLVLYSVAAGIGLAVATKSSEQRAESSTTPVSP